MELIKVENLSYSYFISNNKENDHGQAVPVLTDVSLSIEPGEMVAIMGPSGSGKSTLLYLLGGLLTMQQGSLEIAGQNIVNLSNLEISYFRNRNIGFIFQQFHLLPKTTVLQNILLPTFYPGELVSLTASRKDKRKNESRAIKLAETLGIQNNLAQHPNQLSGGQQQRTAIGRALINCAPLILADEPTGNLDSKAATQIIALLKELNSQGKTILMVTHAPEMAQECSKIFYLKDGKIVDIKTNRPSSTFRQTTADNTEAEKEDTKPQEYPSATIPKSIKALKFLGQIKMLGHLSKLASQNLLRNKGRTFLTMIGIIIGIAAIMAMVTLGQFTKRKVLDSFAELGVNTILFHGYPNWDLKATDIYPISFRFFDWEKDILPLKKIFPEVARLTPLLTDWDSSVTYGGKKIDREVRVLGASSEAMYIVNRSLLIGRNFSPYNVALKNEVCIIGFEIAQRLFPSTPPIDRVIQVSMAQNASCSCKVIGVLKPTTSNKEWEKPNLQIIIPYTLFQSKSKNWWSANIHQVMIQVKPHADIEKVRNEIRAFFQQKYGKSGKFIVDSDSLLIAQMNKFLTLFTILLGLMALVSLAVGGIGITNMMLVSVNERFREIGLKKAIGATNYSVRMQFLLESLVICILAGTLGLLLGIAIYEITIWTAANLTPKVQFEWIIDWWALSLSVISIIAVGILSGLFPALKAEKLQIMEALRAE